MVTGITLLGVWFENSLVVSAAAFLVSFATLVFAATAGPKIRLNYGSTQEYGDTGYVLEVYNV